MNNSVTDIRFTASAGKSIRKACEPFVTGFEDAIPPQLAGLRLGRENHWNGERLFLSYDWRIPEGETIARICLQLFPDHGLLWLGSLTVHSACRRQGIGTAIIRTMERAAFGAKVSTIRMFSRAEAAGFWKRLGYRPEHDPRYLTKSAESGG